MTYIQGQPIGQNAIKEEMELQKLLNTQQPQALMRDQTNVLGYTAQDMGVATYSRKFSQPAYNSLNAVCDWSHQAAMDPREDGTYLAPRQHSATGPRQSKPYIFEPEYPDPANYPRQHSVWSPPCPDPQAWGYDPVAYRAPVVPAQYLQLPERPITPHDTYHYPASHHDHLHVPPAPAVVEPTTDNINAAFSVWYAQQVIHLLVVPEQFREATGGAADEEWGLSGRERDSWARVGCVAQTYPSTWNRSGMSPSTRRPAFEPRDPWNVEWAHATKPSASLVTFILDMIQRMTISPSALVCAVWFLAGLGLHEGDGVKGAELRKHLRQLVSCEPEAVERRVAMLGLILAGKWLDDNSFLTKSWSEVTTIPIAQVDNMERLALKDLNFSLYVPVPAWVDHVNKLFTALDDKPVRDDIDSLVHVVIEKMTKEAREVELDGPVLSVIEAPVERQVSFEEVPAAADQLVNRDWMNWSRSYAHDQKTSNYEDEVEIERAERNVELLLDEDMNDVEDQVMDEEDEDEEEFLEYDGAKRWLPSAAEMKRSTSNSSGSQPRSYVAPATFSSRSATIQTQIQAEPEWSTVDKKSAKTHPWQSVNSFNFPTSIPPISRQRIERRKTPLSVRTQSQRGFHPIHLEPGVSIVRDPVSEFGCMGGMSGPATKRSGYRYSSPAVTARFNSTIPYYHVAAAGY